MAGGVLSHFRTLIGRVRAPGDNAPVENLPKIMGDPGVLPRAREKLAA